MGLGDFTPQAEAYARSRPGYPGALLDRLAAAAGVRPSDPVADLGAGTGILARALAARGLAVTAVEPSAAMRDRAEPHPGVRWVEGSFEATGLAAGSQAWAVAAQAFHWARPAVALPELARVLRPGACLTVLWNDRDNGRSALLTRVEAILARLPGWDAHYRVDDWPAVLRSTGDFGDVRFDLEPHVVAMERARFLELWRSSNTLAECAGSEGLETVLAAIERAVDELGGARVEVPYLCRAWTARRGG